MVYTWSFAAGKPSFRCKFYDNDTVFDHYNPVLFNQSQPDTAYCKANMKISVKECQRCYQKTNSTLGITQIEACQEFVFDRKYYQYTLVEEVRISYFVKEIFNLFLLLVVNGLRSNSISFRCTKSFFCGLYGRIDLLRNLR